MRRDIPVACCHTVFTKEQRTAYKNIWGELEQRRLAVRELENGYRHEFPGDADTLRLVNEWVSMERLCCPFLIFRVTVGSVNEPIQLELLGDEEAKRFLQGELQISIERITAST